MTNNEEYLRGRLVAFMKNNRFYRDPGCTNDVLRQSDIDELVSIIKTSPPLERQETSQSVRVAWKGLTAREQLNCLISLIQEWGFYGKFLKGNKSAAECDLEHIANDDYAKQLDDLTRELEDTKTALKNREDDLRTADGEASRYAGELQKEKELNKHLKRVVVAAQQWKKERETRSHLIDTRHLIDARLIEVLHTTKIVDETVADQAGDSQQQSPEAIMPTSVIGMFATDVVASAAERAAGKVSGMARWALQALAVELRRGT